MSTYIHGTSPDEQRRLSLMNDVLLNPESLREMTLRGDERILDFGSGLGQFTRAMARAAPRGHVVGIERDPAQRETAQRLAESEGEGALAEFRAGDVIDLHLPDGEWGTYDIAHARFVLEHVREPLRVVENMVRAVRPGGRVILADDDHDVMRLWPEPAGFTELWRAYMRSYDRLGNDPLAGRRLVSLLHQAGAMPVRNRWIFFGGCAGMDTFDVVTANMIGVVTTARQTILDMALLDAPTFDAAIAAYRKWARRPDAAIWFSMCWAEGRR
ncbi:MAG TPA: methyltransferase domain-containing protein [Thermoanaerobaculia bacterium]|nr:methyltransferase domain-containing protein [Thermoanaerobaculia bacterium]